MLISVFRHPKDNQPSCGEAPWEALAQTLAAPIAADCTLETCERSNCPHKKNGMLWSPAFYAEGKTRNAVNVEGVSLLVVDIDHVPPNDLGNILGRIWHLKHVVHASHSDRPADRCVRAVIATSRVVKPSEWKKFWRAALHVYGLPGDVNTIDPCRMYFTPSRPKDALSTDAIDGNGYLFYSQDGALLDVDAVLAQAPPEPEPVGGEFDGSDFEIPDFHGAPPVEQLDAAVEALGRAWPSRRRNDAHLALMGGLARAGWPADLIANFCAGVAEIQQRGNGDLPKRFRDATATIEKLLSGTNVVGWTRLRSILDDQGMPGEEAIGNARHALGFPDPVPTPDPTFVAAITSLAPKVEPPKPPPSVAIVGDLKAAQKRLARSTKGAAQTDAELLQRVLRSEIITSEDELGLAAVAVARYSPAGTSPDQIRAVLLPCLSGTFLPHADELVAGAMQTAATTPAPGSRRSAGAAPAGIVDPSQFKINPKTEQPDGTSQHNIRLALHKMEVAFKFDEFANREIMVKEGTEVVIEDHHIKQLRAQMETDFGLRPEKDNLYDICEVIARENIYHPIRDYLDRLPEWDGVSRVETWLIDLGGAQDTPYVRAVARLILVAAVRRVRKPGCKFDEMLILETPEQGRNKSRALKALCPNPEWFTDDFMLHTDTKRMLEMTDGKWIIEAGELKGMSQGDHNAMKQYLSRGTDQARMAYGRKTRRADRQFVIIGTTNDEQYLKDLRNRRYWPVRVVEFDVEKLLEVRDQLWAEALALDLAHPEEEYIRLDRSLYGDASAEQDKRRIDDPFEVALDEVLGDAVGVLNVRDAYKVVGYADKLPNKSDTMAIATALRRIGFERIDSRMVKGVRGTYYAKGSERDTLITLVGTGTEWRVKMLTGGPGPARPILPPGPVPVETKPVN